MLLINVYHVSQMLNTLTDADYDIHVTCIFSTDETISIYDLKRWIHVGLKSLSSHFNITIIARINTAQSEKKFEK
jgi:hypothetical protein